MPMYEFVCSHCHAQFEELLSRDAKASCPKCNSAQVERVLSRVSIGSSSSESAALPSACGRCGDPRGPGACGMN